MVNLFKPIRLIINIVHLHSSKQGIEVFKRNDTRQNLENTNVHLNIQRYELRE